MRTAAQIEPVALFVDIDLLIFRNGVDQFDFETLTHVGEDALGVGARPHFFGEWLVARDDLAHLFLDRREVLRCEWLVAKKVVVEAVVDHRADGDLRARPQRLHGFGEHMRRVMADEFEGARVVAGDKLDLGVMLDRVGQVRELAVKRHGDRALGERRRNALGDIETGCVGRIVPARAVGKGQGDHHSLLLLTRCLRTQVSV